MWIKNCIYRKRISGKQYLVLFKNSYFVFFVGATLAVAQLAVAQSFRIIIKKKENNKKILFLPNIFKIKLFWENILIRIYIFLNKNNK